jgi:hypothetical protein
MLIIAVRSINEPYRRDGLRPPVTIDLRRADAVRPYRGQSSSLTFGTVYTNSMIKYRKILKREDTQVLPYKRKVERLL